jgi:hypothetical protein
MVINMTGKYLSIVGLSLLVIVMQNTEVVASCSCSDQGWNSTYSGYCNNQNWGWYGARKSVSSVEQARRDLVEYFSGNEVKVGRITEKSGYFEAEILNNNNKLVDRVIIHKRSGRIRSIK